MSIRQSTTKSDAAPFVEFMLEMILAAIGESSKSTPQVTPQVSPQVEKLLCVLFGEMTVPNKTAVDCKNID